MKWIRLIAHGVRHTDEIGDEDEDVLVRLVAFFGCGGPCGRFGVPVHGSAVGCCLRHVRFLPSLLSRRRRTDSPGVAAGVCAPASVTLEFHFSYRTIPCNAVPSERTARCGIIVACPCPGTAVFILDNDQTR